MLDSARWQRIFNAVARAQRLIFASAGTKDPKAPRHAVHPALAAPFTVNTMPEATLKALADHGLSAKSCLLILRIRWRNSPRRESTPTLLGSHLQDEGAASFFKSWKDLLECIASKSAALKAA